MTNFTAKVFIEINAPVEKVWEALVTPAIIKEYLFGTNVTSDWKVGSSITYAGDWQGMKYEDKGVILELVPNKKFVSTYWSSMSGTPDMPENYQKVSYELEEKDGKVVVNLTQENAPTQESADHSANNWKMVLEKMKALVEEGI